MTLFVTSVNAITLPRQMWMGLRDNIDPAIAAISVILILITVAVLAVRMVVTREGNATGVGRLVVDRGRDLGGVLVQG